jgi:hypothetical protein
MNSKPLTVEEVKKAAEVFFPLLEEINRWLPTEATIEDRLKIMETVCTLAHKLRVEEDAKLAFGFNKNETSNDVKLEDDHYE